MGTETVLRNGAHGEISHVLFCTTGGKRIYLSKFANELMLDFSSEQINEYYSGEDHEEIFSLKQDIGDILMGEVQPEMIKYKIAMAIGYINSEEVIEVDM